MDTMLAFLIAESARKSGSSMKYYDYKKALKFAKEKGTKKVTFYMEGDRECTEDDLTLKEIENEEEVVGIRGSVWATPMAEINGEEMECWTNKKPKKTLTNH